MSNPKFRIWDKEMECFRNGYELYIEFETGKIWNLSMRDNRRGDVIIEATAQDKFIVQQFTGRSDKNGVELYAGDICKNGDWEDDAHAYNYRINIIEWDEHNTMWMGWNPNTDGMTCEKIGNIFENKDLLERKE